MGMALDTTKGGDTMTDTTDTPKTVTPNQLAAEIFGDEHATRQGKRIRAFLRSNGYRNMTNEKGQAWSLAPDTADIVREKFLAEVK
jgi:hypothetical protein